jgi:hypothetical protein
LSAWVGPTGWPRLEQLAGLAEVLELELEQLVALELAGGLELVEQLAGLAEVLELELEQLVALELVGLAEVLELAGQSLDCPRMLRWSCRARPRRVR